MDLHPANKVVLEVVEQSYQGPGEFFQIVLY